MFFLHLYSYPIILIIITLGKGVYYIKESQPFVAGSLLFSYCSGFNQEPVPLILNGLYPQGRRISIGVFQTVISTLSYEDLVLNTGAVRGDYNKKLTAPVMEEVPDSEYMGSTLNVEPYHFEGDENN